MVLKIIILSRTSISSEGPRLQFLSLVKVYFAIMGVGSGGRGAVVLLDFQTWYKYSNRGLKVLFSAFFAIFRSLIVQSR